ncbi:hypothetical protein ACFWUP_04330 [Nocardia sp. NPDC058658]|uniref:hypothetical protein n=1 Tax=Nocardia sp. NPDC058658 TaxID=3346580 RepID=UPI00364EC2EE
MQRRFLTGTAAAALLAALTLTVLADTEQSASAAPASVAEPAPHILPFADVPKGPKRGPSARGNIAEKVEASIDGCDHRYGTAAQCVPWTLPAGVKNKDQCAWLAAHGLRSLRVVGEDRLRLDNNRDGIACGAGD